MYKVQSKIVMVAIAIILCLSISVPAVLAEENRMSMASNASSGLTLDEKNELFTAEDTLMNLVTMDKDTSLTIQGYEQYVYDTFKIETDDKFVSDEQIFRIVPEEIFINLLDTDDEYSYIGLQYVDVKTMQIHLSFKY